jgi:amino acid adenylation domain-containing protein
MKGTLDDTSWRDEGEQPAASTPPSLARGREPAQPAADFVNVLAQVAARRPEHIAVEGPDARLTYADVDRLSNQLAHRLMAMGVGPEQCVGVSMPRGAAELIAMLAVSKAGAAYVPLDPSHPIERLRLILEDAAPGAMIVHPSSPVAGETAAARNLIVLDDLQRATAGQDFSLPRVPREPSQLAYVLFTSGSTGRPKGVEITRGAFSNFLRSMAHEPGLDPRDRLLAVSTTSFDIAGLELFLPLYVGATVIVVERATVMDPRRLRARLESDAITMMQATPATWRLLLEAGWTGHAGLRMLCGGEAMNRTLADRLLAGGGELWNMYGPTETTVWSTLQRIRAGEERISIGKPIDRTQVYILDGERGPVARGEVGEIYIGGEGLARGYRGRQDLTSERFVQNPGGPAGDRIYRTGDLGRLAADGTFECLGRIDHQIKIRGFRIELEEIEAVLRKVPGVREVLVVAENIDGDPRLCAYWTGSAVGPTLVDAARRALPSYMVPSGYVPLAAFPLNPNGKIDRAKLPLSADVSEREPWTLKLPRYDAETRLAAIWSSLLGRERIGVDQDFFAIGGTSVLAIEACLRMEQQTGVEVPLATFFESPTIEGMASYLGRARGEVSPNRPIVVDLRRASNQREPLFCLLGVHLYQKLAFALPADRPVVGMHLPFRYVPGSGERPSVSRMARGYLELIRARQAHGPYYLAGLCFGGIVAFEVARQLEATGEKVALVAVFDGMLPSGARTAHVRRLLAYARIGLTEPRRVPAALRRRLAPVINRLPRASLPKATRMLDVEIDGPEADAEVSRFAASVTGISARLLVIRALENDYPSWVRVEPHLGWEGLADDLRTYDVRATHLGLLRDPHVELLARAIADAMDEDVAASPADENAVRKDAGS